MHTKEQEKNGKNARMGRIRTWKTRAVAPACSVEVGGVGDTGNLSEGYQFGITFAADHKKNVPPSLITGFESALRAAASSSSTATSYGALRPGTRFM